MFPSSLFTPPQTLLYVAPIKPNTHSLLQNHLLVNHASKENAADPFAFCK
jgi:hypothetical protein